MMNWFKKLMLFRLVKIFIQLKKLTTIQKLKKLKRKFQIMINMLLLMIFQMQYLIKDKNKQDQQQLMILILLRNTLSKMKGEEKNQKQFETISHFENDGTQNFLVV